MGRGRGVHLAVFISFIIDLWKYGYFGGFGMFWKESGRGRIGNLIRAGENTFVV